MAMGLPWAEWLVVVPSLLITLGIGLWFSRKGTGALEEYMLGSRNMHVLPVCLSLVATALSGSAFAATSQEVYLFGMQPAYVGPFMYMVVGLLSSWLYLPVSYSIKSASIFEFFDRRFNNHIRKVASIIYSIEIIFHTAMVQYIPAASLSLASGLPTFPIACVLSLICLAYTATGGLKAVAWADSCQAVIFTVCGIALAVTGIILIGGPVEMWRKGEEGSRMEFFNMDPSPHVRYTVPIIVIGCIFVLSQGPMSPSIHQRIASMPTYQDARKVVIWSYIMIAVFFVFTYTMGLIVYAYFAGCDPVLAKKGISTHATILPYFVNQISQKLPGIEGLFYSGLLASGLSTTTSCWNTVACTAYEDLIVPWLGPRISERTAFRILMGIVVIASIISTTLILLIQTLPSLEEASVAFKELTMSVHFVLYNGGMFLPWVNSKGIVAGSLVSGVMTNYIVLGATNAKRNKLIQNLPKILTTAKCIVNGTTMEALNMTTTIGTDGYGLKTVSDPSVPWLFTMSYSLYMVPGVILGLVVSYLASWMTGGQDLTKVDREMIVPIMHWALPQQPESEDDNLKTVEMKNVPLHNYVVIPQKDNDIGL